MSFAEFAQLEEDFWANLCVADPAASVYVVPTVRVLPFFRQLSFTKDDFRLVASFDIARCTEGRMPATFVFYTRGEQTDQGWGDWMDNWFYGKVTNLLNRHFIE